jgi:hypothetical protein
MVMLDIFNQDAFDTVSLTGAFNRQPFRPTMLGSMPGLFDPVPIRNKYVAIEQRNGVLKLILATERGAPIDQRTTEKRDIRNFGIHRLAKGDTIMADELTGIREFGSETELSQVMAEVQRRYTGANGIQADISLTFEHMRLGAVQGIVLDADGSTLENWFTEWSATQATEINFALTTATTNIRGLCNQVRRQMQRAAAGSWMPTTQVHALVGDAFWDAFVDHPKVRDTYLSWSAAAELREANEFDTFYFGKIYWHNYRGTDNYDEGATDGTADASTVGIPTDKAKFFPVNAPGVFQHVMGPAEFMPWINTLGQPVYGMQIPDRDRGAWVKVEVYSYPLFLCTRPAMLQRARRA